MRLATPGAILMFAGIVLLWWGLGIVRGEVGGLGGGIPRRIGGTIPKPSTDGQQARGSGGRQLLR